MFPLIRAKTKWNFEGIMEEGAGKVAAHDMVKRDEEGLEPKRGVYINPLGSPPVAACFSFSGDISGRPRVRLLSGYRERGDKAG
jgi:hypothetical protein